MSMVKNGGDSRHVTSTEAPAAILDMDNHLGTNESGGNNPLHLTEDNDPRDGLPLPEGLVRDDKMQGSAGEAGGEVHNRGQGAKTDKLVGLLSLNEKPRTQSSDTLSKELPKTPPHEPIGGGENSHHTAKPTLHQPSESEEYNEKDGQFVPYSTNHDSDVEKMNLSSDANLTNKDSQPEIQSIMEQFTGESEAPREDEIMSPRLGVAKSLSGTSSGFPPRRSSLEPVRSRPTMPFGSTEKDLPSPPVPPKTILSPVSSPNSLENVVSSPVQVSAPPLPEPEPDLPFDFHRFLEQLRHKSADPVAKFLRSFLNEFGKKQWMVHEQVKIIGDFLTFIANKMALCDVWRDVSDAEFDNAKEGMEKLVMNRLYGQTFSPAILPPPLPPRVKGRRKELDKMQGPGRRGQHQEDVERDDILAQKFRIYAWVKEEHLDIPPVGARGERFLKLAQQELLKIKGYRAPRDKVICVLNCCKVIVGLLKSSKSADTSADAFVPLLIYVVLQAHPEHLVSNLQYVLRFRNQDKLSGEAGYYLSSLTGAIQFIETLDRTSLTISDENFERHVELAVSAIAEKEKETEKRSRNYMVSDKSAISEPEVTPRTSMDASRSSPVKRSSRATVEGTDGGPDDHDAVAGLLRTIQRPLSTIGRMFSDEPSTAPSRRNAASGVTPAATPRLSPSLFQPPRSSVEKGRPDRVEQHGSNGQQGEMMLDAQEAAAMQASAETAEARRVQGAEHQNVVETLYSMFPSLDKDVIDDVVRLKEGRVGPAVDACLALNADE